MKTVRFSSFSPILTRLRNRTNSVLFACPKSGHLSPHAYLEYVDSLGMPGLARQHALHRGREQTG